MKHELERLRGRAVIVALSGGGDSMALLHLARESGLAVVAAHVDHGLRPESSAEAQQLRDWLPDVELLTRRVPVAEKAQEWGLGLEAAGRRLRYAWLRRLARERDAVVVTGHNRDDVAETLLLRLIRGTSVSGLGGPRRWRGDWLFRPLLQIAGEELRDYLRERGLPWLEDPSNAQPRFLRSWVRGEVMPLLQSRNPQLAAGLARLAESAAELREETRRRARRLHDGPDFVPPTAQPLELRFEVWARAWRAAHPAEGARFARKHFDLGEIWWAQGGNGSFQLPGGLFLRRKGAGLSMGSAFPPGLSKGGYAAPSSSPPGFSKGGYAAAPGPVRFECSGDGPWTWHFPDWGLRLEISPSVSTGEAEPWRADLRPLSEPLTLRGRSDGDRFGSAKLKKYFLQWGIAQPERAGVPLLCDERNTVVWAIGHRVRREYLAEPGEPCWRFYFAPQGEAG